VSKLAKKILAGKLKILESIARRKLFWAYELEQQFGYCGATIGGTSKSTEATPAGALGLEI
jgi:hypothetical protein